ncbi:MAG: hypothetical protein H6584_03375 [Flavobacteriales bacterium]|nr:hypothetical protein [Flavobacteriales bacterium]
MIKQLLFSLFFVSITCAQTSDSAIDTNATIGQEIQDFGTIGVLKKNNRFVASCSKTLNGKYIVAFSNIESGELDNEQIQFVGKESIDDLYKSIVSGFHGLDVSSNKEYRKQIIIFNTDKMGVLDILNYHKKVQLTFINKNGAISKSEWFTKEQIDSLFGV